MRIEQHQIGRCADGQAPNRQAQGLGRAGRQAGEQGRQVEQAVLHQGHGQRQQQLDAADTRLGRGERRQLGVRLMGLVVAGDGRDHPGLDRRPQAVAVGLGAQRRLHVIEAGEVAQGLIGQDQLIQGHVGSHRQAACLGVGNHLRAASTGQLAEVSAHARLFHQQQVTGQGHGFGAFRDAGQAEEARRRPFMGDAAGRQVVVLGMQDHGQVEGGGIFQGAAQGAVVVEAVQAIAKGHAAGVAQGHQLGQLFAVEVFAQGADGEDLAVSGFAGAVENQLGNR